MSDAPVCEERPGFVSGARRRRYQLTFEGTDDPKKDAHALRWFLKRLLRDRGLRCTEAREL